MADRGSCGLSPRLDIQQLLSEAKHRWLRPAEICEILRNYQTFSIASEPPHRPLSGSLFLFDRKVLRYFRKDGHNWRKKKDGKTVKEAHEKLKVGSIDVLHCYYAHGEQNENFQRRSYWILEEDLMHIVFVHYLEVKGSRTNVGVPREADFSSSSRKSSPTSSDLSKSYAHSASANLDSPSTVSSLTSFCEDADFELPAAHIGNGPLLDQMEAGFPNLYYLRPNAEHVRPGQKDGHMDCDKNSRVNDSQKTLGSVCWEEILLQCSSGSRAVPSHVSASIPMPDTSRIVQTTSSGLNFSMDSTIQGDLGTSMSSSSNWQTIVNNSLPFPKERMEQLSELETVYNLGASVCGHRNYDAAFENSQKILRSHLEMQNEQNMSSNLQFQLANGESCLMKFNSEKDLITDVNVHYASTLRQSLLGGDDSFKKVDSFSRWISRELEDVDDLHMRPSFGIPWCAEECGNIGDDSSLSPSLSQDQLFSITDFSPKWTFTDLETEVLIVGSFLGNQQDVVSCNWSCMFGEVEVPATVLADGILCCHAPPHNIGQVPFYVTFSNRLACSEVREFQYLAGSVKDVDVTDIYEGGTKELLLHLQLDSLLSLNSLGSPNNLFLDDLDKRSVIRKLIALKDEEVYNVEPNPQGLIQQEKKKFFFKNLMQEMLYSWLLHKVVEDGKGPNVLDENGQGVIHLAAALGYDWAIKPVVTAGVSVNFRDVNGWTGLHWAAYCGREQTVAVLFALGAGAGVLTDPTPEFPLGRTPADLASANGHKGISGFLAESSLTSHLSTLTMNDTKPDGAEVSSTKGLHSVSERIATPANDRYLPGELSLKDSLTAVSNATQVADRIHLMFRIQSFQRKQFAEHEGDEYGLLDDRSLSIVAARALKTGQGNGLAHAAAIHIQKKYRGWKKRKEFLLIRQRIVKLQAHVRGHQVRKKYPSITWSVGIVDTLLRWRRKRSSIRGFTSDALPKEPFSESKPEEDDYDFLKKGRRQAEERFQKALTRVKSMAQDPKGRDQYRRLLTLVHGIRENKVIGMAITSSETIVDEELINFDDILDDDTLISITFD